MRPERTQTYEIKEMNDTEGEPVWITLAEFDNMRDARKAAKDYRNHDKEVFLVRIVTTERYFPI